MASPSVVVLLLCFTGLVLSTTGVTAEVVSTATSSDSGSGSTNGSSYVVRRNVMDYGARGDGVTDDTHAFILAMTQDKATTYVANGTSWNASQYNCQTTKPSIVLVPGGTYLLSALIPLTYYTQLVGDNFNRATLKFIGSDYHCLDAGIDEGPGHGWYGGVNQDNFYHQVRNLVIDITDCTRCVAIHWQVSQATNLVNLGFLLGDPTRNNTGILMEDGSGGYFGDVTVDGGLTGLAVGNQQFTVRNVSVKNAVTAINMFWNWVWAFHDIRISNCSVGFQLDGGVSSISIVDAHIEDTLVGVNVSVASQVLLDRVNMTNNVRLPLAFNGTLTVTSPSEAYSYAYSRMTNGSFVQGPVTLPPRPAGLVEPVTGKYVGRTRPNYDEYITAATLVNGSDVTTQLQQLLNANVGTPIFIPYGTYFISDTVIIPTGSRIFGEVWTRFAAIGENFQDPSNPRAVFQVGMPNDIGVVELADLLFTTHGPAPGAIFLEWYTRGQNPADSGIWDVHYRIGGANGTLINDTLCSVNATFAFNSSCYGVHTLFHIKPNASVYAENVWGWTADHDIDIGNSLNIFNARGMVVETKNPVWLYGTAMEHNYLFQYNLHKAEQVLLSIIQTETAYYQPQFALAPLATSPVDPRYPTFQQHGFSIAASQVRDIVLYGAGMYSFFFRWHTSGCGADPVYCQLRISQWTEAPPLRTSSLTSHNDRNDDVDVKLSLSSSSSVRLHNYNTHGAENVLQWNLIQVAAKNATNGFCSTVSLW